jgi:outer membrane protein assembly factor BamB
VGQYVLLARLGAGGMGVVYLGRSPAGRTVAVKVIRERFAGDDGFAARFRREVAAARLVTGAFTAPVLDADPGAAAPWLVTAYVPGISLREAIGAHGALPPASVRTLAAGLAEALVDIHRAGVVHRDLKPGNIMLTRDGPRVIDFGIARPEDATVITRLGAVLGSPGYMSPEQVAGEPAGPASDLFSLGAVLVFAATARAPFGTGTTDEVLRRVARVEVALDDVTDRGLRTLISLCLQADPARRPSAGELLDRLPDGGDALPASLISLIDHRVEQAKLLPEAPVDEPAPVYGATTIDPSDSQLAETRPVETRPIPPRRLSRRRLVGLGGGLVVAAGAGALLASSGGEVAGRPRAATTTRAAPREPAITSVWRQPVSTAELDLTLTGGVLLARGREGGIRALDPGTGRLLWSREAESVETVAGDLAFLVNPRGWLLTALHVPSGTVRWTFQPEPGFESRPVAVVGSVVWCCVGSMYGLDINDGRQLARAGSWNLEMVTTNGFLVALWPDRIGGHDPNNGDHTWMVSVADPTDPQAASGLVFYVDPDGTGYAMRADNGVIVWQRPGIGSTLPYWFQVGGDTAYSSADGQIVALDAATGQPRWTRSLGRRNKDQNRDQCVLGLVDTTLYAADADGTTHALDAGSGHTRWTHRTEGRVVACPVGLDDLVFLATGDGYVEAIRPPRGP